jgi:hypothetical protein
MESSLHRSLKTLYAGSAAQCEVRIDGYRIDAVARGRLVEVQHASLASIRKKVSTLLEHHRVTVVKPMVARKQLVQLDRPSGQEMARRYSPKRGTLLDVFDELVYFVTVFPHSRLTLEIPVVEIEEWRYPVKSGRRRKKDYGVDDQYLRQIVSTHRLRRSVDLLQLLPGPLPASFDTADLARQFQVRRWVAQRIAYCLRECGVVEAIGKCGNSRLYRTRKRKALA